MYMSGRPACCARVRSSTSTTQTSSVSHFLCLSFSAYLRLRRSHEPPFRVSRYNPWFSDLHPPCLAFNRESISPSCFYFFFFVLLMRARARTRWPIVANNARTYCAGRPIIILSPAGSGCVNRTWAGGEGIMSAAFLLSCSNEDRKWSWKVCLERGRDGGSCPRSRHKCEVEECDR